MDTADPAALLAHADWLRALARRLVGASAAEDAAQDTFVAALRSPPDPALPARPWLARVLRNVTRMDHRSATRRAAREDVVAIAAADRAHEAPDAAVQRMETFRALVELVLALPEPLRTTLVRHYFDGDSLADIARRDGVPAGTVRWRHKQAIDQLRARLDARSGGDRAAWLASLAPLAAAPPTHAATLTLTLGGLVVSKVLVGAAVVAAIGGVVAWRLVPRDSSSRSSSSSQAQLAAPPSSASPTAARPADAALAPKHVRVLANAAERAQLAEQLAAAHAQHAASIAAAAPTRAVHLPDDGESGDDPHLHDEVTRLLPIMKDAMREALPYLGTCYTAARPTLGADHLEITAHLSLSSDPDIGTLIDAKQLFDAAGNALPVALDGCLREQLMSLELPPLAEDETVEVDYPLGFADDEDARDRARDAAR